MHTLSDTTFDAFSRLMHVHIGVHFTPAKQPLVASRLAPRIQKLGLAGYDDYLVLIEANPAGSEFQVAVDLLTTNETYFFREPAHFALIEQELVRSQPLALRVWSAAASYGDEAYSLAMLLADLQRRGQLGSDWRVLGTDISDRVLRSAVEGVYPEDRLRHVAPDRLRRHCLRGSGEDSGLVQMSAALRRHVQFGQLNLCLPMEDIGPFDIVLLRNVLIYFDNDTKAAVIDRVLTQLRPGGLFFIGTAEGRVACGTALQPIGPGAFRKPAKGG